MSKRAARRQRTAQLHDQKRPLTIQRANSQGPPAGHSVRAVCRMFPGLSANEGHAARSSVSPSLAGVAHAERRKRCARTPVSYFPPEPLPERKQITNVREGWFGGMEAKSPVTLEGEGRKKRGDGGAVNVVVIVLRERLMLVGRAAGVRRHVQGQHSLAFRRALRG